MLSVSLISATLALAYAQYNDNNNNVNVDKDGKAVQLKAKNLAEAYITGKNKNGQDAAVYYSTAQAGVAKWAAPKKLYQKDLIDPRGAKLCGPKNEAGQHNWLYVADAGNDEVGGYVYRYEIQRDDENVGKLSVGKAEIVYGQGKGDQRPTDIACDEAGNVWWNDEAKNEIWWARADVLNNNVCNHGVCGGAEFVYGCEHAVQNLQGLEVAGNWVYWSQNDQQIDQWAPKAEVNDAEDGENVEEEDPDKRDDVEVANNGVWRVAINDNQLDGGKCNSCEGAQEKGQYPSKCGAGDEIEFFSQKEDGYVAIAQRNDFVYAVANDNKVYSLGKNDPNAAQVKDQVYAEDASMELLGHASYVADAGKRGLLVVDEIKGNAYVVDDAQKNYNKAFALPQDVYAYGAAYGEGVEVDEDENNVQDSAVSIAMSAVAGLVALAAFM